MSDLFVADMIMQLSERPCDNGCTSTQFCFRFFSSYHGERAVTLWGFSANTTPKAGYLLATAYVVPCPLPLPQRLLPTTLSKSGPGGMVMFILILSGSSFCP